VGDTRTKRTKRTILDQPDALDAQLRMPISDLVQGLRFAPTDTEARAEHVLIKSGKTDQLGTDAAC
jgi:hypothetical protein